MQQPLLVVEDEIVLQVAVGVPTILVVLEVHLLVFVTSPQPLGEDVVEAVSATVHTDLHSGVEEHSREVGARELASLVAVKIPGVATSRAASSGST